MGSALQRAPRIVPHMLDRAPRIFDVSCGCELFYGILSQIRLNCVEPVQTIFPGHLKSKRHGMTFASFVLIESWEIVMKSVRTLFAATFLVMVVSSALRAAPLIALVADDTTITSNKPLIYDAATGTLVGSWKPDGTIVQDLAYDPSNGDQYALTVNGVYKRTLAGVQSQILGIPGAPSNGGGDLAVSPLGVLSIVQDDVNVIPSFKPQFYDKNTGAGLGSWKPDGTIVLDQAYDPVTGDLYALTQGGVFKRTPAGVQSQVPGVPGAPAGLGGDIAVSPLGVLSYVQDDLNLVPSSKPQFYDKTTGAFLGSWKPDGSVVLDQAYDPVTGDLYALTQNGVYKRTPAGVQTQIAGLPGGPINRGGDISVFAASPVPEPSSVALLLMGAVGLIGYRRRTLKKQRTT
jgi:hypothetical protein